MITNPIAGILLFAAVMWGVFYVSQVLVGPLIADWLVGWIETFQGWVSDKLAGGSPFLQALIADGIVGGVGAVVGFLPLVMVMYNGSEVSGLSALARYDGSGTGGSVWVDLVGVVPEPAAVAAILGAAALAFAVWRKRK